MNKDNYLNAPDIDSFDVDDELDISEMIHESVNMLIGSLIGWQIKPVIANRGDKDKEIFDKLRNILAPLKKDA